MCEPLPQLPCLTRVCLHAGVARLVDSNKRWVTLASGCLLILVPWMQISRAAASNIAVTPSSIAWVSTRSKKRFETL